MGPSWKCLKWLRAGIGAAEGSRVRDITEEGYNTNNKEQRTKKLVWDGIVIELRKFKMWKKINLMLLSDPSFV